MKKTFVTVMPNHIGAFLKASRCFAELGVNITRVSYNKAVDSHTLFIDAEGTAEQLEKASEMLEKIGYLQCGESGRTVILLEFRLRDVPGSVTKVLELIEKSGFNISYMSSQENGTDCQYFKMGKKQLKAVDDVNFEIKKGEVFGLVGESGCGKTTTMNIVSNIIPKDSGEINFGKENCKIGYLPETPSMFTYMNGYEYLDYIASCCSYKDDKKKRIDEVINIVGMAEGGKRRIKGYSRGMNQRLGIAAAIFDHPDLLILDEPTSALDPQGRAEVMSIIKNLADMGTTIILCTHILSDVERTANRIGIVRDGRMAVEGTIAEIKGQYDKVGKKIVMGIFGDPTAAIQPVSTLTGGNFYFDRQRAVFEIPLASDINEQETAHRLFDLLNSAGLTISLFVIENKTLEQIYMETIG